MFLRAAGLGALLFFLYRVLGVLHCLMSGRKAAVFDLLYWLLAGSAFFVEIYRYNEGILRIFLFLAVFSGAFLMNSLLKRLLFQVKRGRISIIRHIKKRYSPLENRFCDLKRGKQIERVKKKEKKHKNIK